MLLNKIMKDYLKMIVSDSFIYENKTNYIQLKADLKILCLISNQEEQDKQIDIMVNKYSSINDYKKALNKYIAEFLSLKN